MTPEQTEAVKKYAQAIAEILYADTDPKTLESLEAIGQVVRQKLLEHVSPQVGIFYPTVYQNRPRQKAIGQELSRRVDPE